jgi:hypothetical protein
VHHRAYEDAAVIDEFGGYYGVVNETPDMDAGFDEEGEASRLYPSVGAGNVGAEALQAAILFSRGDVSLIV